MRPTKAQGITLNTRNVKGGLVRRVTSFWTFSLDGSIGNASYHRPGAILESHCSSTIDGQSLLLYFKTMERDLQDAPHAIMIASMLMEKIEAPDFGDVIQYLIFWFLVSQ